jgi:hypothetical protein
MDAMVRRAMWATLCTLLTLCPGPLGCASDDDGAGNSASDGSDEDRGQEARDVECRTAEDCEPGQRCRLDLGVSRRLLQETPVALEPCTAPRACESDVECADIDGVCRLEGDSGTLVPPSPAGCVPFGGQWPARFCVAPWSEDSCDGTRTCSVEGHCTLDKCTDEGAAPCPDYWRCDAALAARTLTAEELLTPGGLTTYGAEVVASETPYQRGCVLLRCDEAGGSPCETGFHCDTALAEPDSVGCVVTPCEELGACSDDERYVCEPTSEAARPSGEDVHGCVLRNCEEGLPCADGFICEAAHAGADASGCRLLHCSEAPDVCAAGWACDGERAAADDHGCHPISCVDGPPCTEPYECDPAHSLADPRGCAPPPWLECPECILPPEPEGESELGADPPDEPSSPEPEVAAEPPPMDPVTPGAEDTPPDAAEPDAAPAEAVNPESANDTPDEVLGVCR